MFTIYYNLHTYNGAACRPIVHPFAACDIAKDKAEADQKTKARAAQGYEVARIIEAKR